MIDDVCASLCIATYTFPIVPPIQHQTKDCIIHSTYIAPTAVFPQQEHDPKPHNLQQSASPIFNVEFPPERALHVGPKSSVVVPVSVFPHWKKPYEDVPHRSHHPPEEEAAEAAAITANHHDGLYGILDGGATHLRRNGTESITDTILMDTVDIIQNAPPKVRNDEAILSKHQIYETIIANTSWGFFQMKVPTVCSPPSKEYEYGLPNNLIFLDGGGGWYARRNTTPTAELAHLFGDTTIMPAKDALDPLVYNIYMNNPSEEEVRIVEVFTTKPDLVGLEMRCNKTLDASVYYPLIGSRILPRRNNIYVGTVRLFPENFRSSMLSSMQELGFLVIRTNVGVFTTALDFIPNRLKKDYVLKVSTDYTTLSDTHFIRDHVVDELVKNVTKSAVKNEPYIADDMYATPLSVIKSYRLSEQATDPKSNFTTIMAPDSDRQASQYRDEDELDTPVLKVLPDEIDFGTITSGSHIIGRPITLGNPTYAPIRVIRVSVVMKTIVTGEGVNATELVNEPHGLDIGFSYPDSPPSWGIASVSKNSTTGREDLVYSEEIVIPERNMVLNALNVWCKFTAIPGEGILPRYYEGSIIFRVTHATEGSSQNWEENFVRFDEDSEGVNYASKIDFKGSILPGSFGISHESVLFPTHHIMLPAMSKYIKVESVLADNREYYDRDLDVKNNFGVPVSITAMHLHERNNDYCRTHFSIPAFEKGKDIRKTAAEGEKWKGLTVRYHIQNDDDMRFTPSQCVLTFETDIVGNQSIPLVVYTGNLIAEIERPDSSRAFPPCFEDGQTNGMACMNQWSVLTPEGSVLRGAMRDMRKGRASWPRPCGQMKSLEQYFCSLTSSPSRSCSYLKPIVMEFGPVSAGSVVKRSFYLTNLNPLPVQINAATAVMGNMTVSIGHVPIYMPDVLNEANRNGAFKQFLQHSTFAQDVFSKLQHKADISLSERAKGGGERESWFYQQQVIHAASNVTFLGNISEVQEMKCGGGFLLSTDGSCEKSFTSKQQSAGETISIPANGIARFEVAVRIQDRSVLKNDVTPFVSTGLILETDYGQNMPIVITYRALSGQLELKPSNVDNMFYCGWSYEDAGKNCSIQCPTGSLIECPTGMGCWADTACVTAKYDADEDKNSDVSSAYNNSESLTPGEPLIVEVPATIRDKTVDSERSGIQLSIESTFSHDILVSEVKSCNKWFSVIFLPRLNETGTLSLDDSSRFIPIKGRNEKKLSEQSSSSLSTFGTAYSAISCSHPSKDDSFYACALEWLERRDHVQPSGCGLPEERFRKFDESHIKSVKSRAITTIRDAVTFLSSRYTSQMTSSDNDGSAEKIKAKRVKMFDAARSAWNEVVSSGLNVVTGDISAKTVYGSPGSSSETPSIDKGQGNGEISLNENTLLTLPMPSVLLQSTLNIPQLFAGGSKDEPDLLEFDTTHVGETTYRNVLLNNPTGMNVRVRLTAAEISGENDEDMGNNVFVQSSPSDYHPWWTGGSYWMSDNIGNLISATHNVTIKSGAGAFVSLLNPALHTMSSFVLGCGSRCSISNEVDSTVEEKLYSAVGAASGSDSELFGQPHDKASLEQGKKSTPHQVLGLSDPPPFSLGRTSLNEVILPPHSIGTLGPVKFRPSSRSDFSGSLYIENSLTGIEEVKLHGSGGWENLVFVDDDTIGEGGDVEYRFGQSALVFSGSSSSGGDSIVKSFVLSNEGDFPVKIASVSMASSEVEHFTLKRKHPSFSFRHDGLISFWSDWKKSPQCSSRGFSLLGCKDKPSFTLWNAVKHLIRASRKRSQEQEKPFDDSFELLPNENKTFYVEHRPDCSFMTSYASVIFEVDSKRNRHQAFRSKNVELIVGFDMNGHQLSRCIPFSPPDSNFWTKSVSFTLPSLMRDVLSLGLTKITDANGNPKIPNRPIQVSYLVAALILILLLMSIDLMYWSDFPPEGSDTCSSWNATCRCLARADPASSDLIAIGKEQTKHVLLSRYRKEGILPSHCVSSDGNFRRDKGANAGVHNTFSDSIFKKHKTVQDAKIKSDGESVLPGGLCWRTAFSRRIGRCDIPRTSSMMSRTRELYAKHQKLQKALVDAAPPPLTTEKEAGKTLNGNSAIVKTKKVEFAPAPQDRAPQGRMVDSTDWVKASSSATGKKTKPKSDQHTKQSATIESKVQSSVTATVSTPSKKTSTSTYQSKVVESAKPKVSGKVDARELTSKKPLDTKSQQKRQNDVESTKKDRTISKQEAVKEEVLSKKIKRKSVEKSDTKAKSETNPPNDLSGGKAKQARQNKTANGAIKAADQTKPKEGKKKSKATKNVKQLAGAARTKPSNATSEDFPPLSSTASAAANVRPPPGLLAPPGFNEQPALSNSFPQTLSPQASTAMSSPTRSLSSPSAGLSLLDSASFNLPPPALSFNDGFSLGGMPVAPASPTRTSNEDIMSFLDMRHANSTPPPPPPLRQESQSKEDVKDLLGSDSDFNISNFLDGILSDEPPITNEAPKPALTESNLFQAVAAVPLDPWNNSSAANNSTAADDPLSTLLGSTSTQGSGNDPSVIAGIPLNSGASSLFGSTIQSNNVSSQLAYASLVSDDGEKDNDFNEPDSFYNQLLGED